MFMSVERLLSATRSPASKAGINPEADIDRALAIIEEVGADAARAYMGRI